MERVRSRGRLATFGAAAIAAFAVTVCRDSGGGRGQAGGLREPLVLRLADTNGQLDFTPAVVQFVDQVEERSGGDLRIDVLDEWGDFACDPGDSVSWLRLACIRLGSGQRNASGPISCLAELRLPSYLGAGTPHGWLSQPRVGCGTHRYSVASARRAVRGRRRR
jgi:hypothetical protein